MCHDSSSGPATSAMNSSANASRVALTWSTVNAMRKKNVPPSGSVECWSEETMLASRSCKKREIAAMMPGRSAHETSRRASAISALLGLRRLGAPAAQDARRGAGGDRERRQVGGHHAVGADHAALADRHAAGDHDVRAAPDVVADARRALGGEALPGHRLGQVVEAMVGVGDEAAVCEHAVVADLDELLGGDHHVEVEERSRADAHARVAGQREPDAGLEERVLADLQPALQERLQDVAVHGPPA